MENIQVHLDFFILCVDIPDCPEYFGTDKLCGLAGSYNGYCGDDMVYPNKTIFEDQGYPCTYGNRVNKWANTWNTKNYFFPSVYNDTTTCDAGVDIVENRTCDFAIHQCEPIRSALKGIKAFSQCQDLDYAEVYSEYGKCVDHICENKLSKCDALENFANFCEKKLNGIKLNKWRTQLNCSLE
uniref:VWF/SSPO/Zonadhesin-like cysteine-rich domain-containing protein n=1 Tax=Panagrolaimus superbus TaxID=310955 RepID=A0A914ZBN9_9BILA